MARRAPLALLLLALLASPLPARADHVPPPPSSCPKDTHPVTGHMGTGCAPDHCPVGSEGGICSGGRPCCQMPLCGGGRDPSCGMGRTCAEVRICATPGKTISVSGQSFREATGYCGESTGCPAGSTCEIVATCITSSGGSVKTPGSRRAACSCGVVGAPEPAPLAPPLLALLAALARRRFRARTNIVRG